MFENQFSFPKANDLNIYYCGKRIKTPNHSYGPEIRTHYLIVLIKEGYGTLFCEDKAIRLSPDNVLVMFPNEKIHYVVDNASKWTISWVGVYGKLVDDFFKSINVSPDNPVFHLNNAFEASEILENIYNQSLKNTIRDKLKCISLLYDFFGVLLSENTFLHNHNYVHEALSIIDYNFEKDISVKSLSDNLHINNCYLSRIFKKETGMTPKEYILDKKINRACEILSSASLSIKETSDSLGFSDPMYFSRIFKQKTGLSPSEFKKERNKKNECK